MRSEKEKSQNKLDTSEQAHCKIRRRTILSINTKQTDIPRMSEQAVNVSCVKRHRILSVSLEFVECVWSLRNASSMNYEVSSTLRLITEVLFGS